MSQVICNCRSCQGKTLDETDFWYIRCGTVESIEYFKYVATRFRNATDPVDKAFSDHYASVLRLKKQNGILR